MRKVLAAGCLALATAPALAGGTGDPSAVLKEKNAICDRQRRGESLASPSFCLPELPVTPVYDDRERRRPHA